MLPMMPGPDPRSFGFIAIAVVVVIGGGAVALFGFMGWEVSQLVAAC